MYFEKDGENPLLEVHFFIKKTVCEIYFERIRNELLPSRHFYFLCESQRTFSLFDASLEGL